MKRNSTKKSVKAVAAAAGVAAVMLLPGCSTAAGGTGAPVVGGGGGTCLLGRLHLTNGGRRPAGNFGSWWAAFGVQLIGPAEEFSRRYA